ncbi:NAD(P)-binding domain-containing protein [Streptomyces sp. NPDC008222]|uniref:NAD(P)-binding domain-containing protein n=1 Tax=Streptomyces sp. NPDC008222 TaxID=3364820 RepID=UPI0036E2AE18
MSDLDNGGGSSFGGQLGVCAVGERPSRRELDGMGPPERIDMVISGGCVNVNETTGPPRLPVVGFIGLSGPGLKMARAISEAGFPLRLLARRPASLEPLVGVFYEALDTVEDLAAACDVVALRVRTDVGVLKVVQRMLPRLRPGTVVVNHESGSPACAMLLTELCAGRGVMVVDAPVSGGRSAAEEKRLTTMVGGPHDAVERCIPIFRSFSADIAHLGASGAGQAGNMFKDALGVLMNQAAIEDSSVAAGQGLDIDRLLAVLKLDHDSGALLHHLLSTALSTDNTEKLSRKALEADNFEGAVRCTGAVDSEVTSRTLTGACSIPALLSGSLGPHAWDDEHAAVRKAIAIMQDRLAETLTLADIAAEVHLSVYHFLRVFRLATGETPYRYLTRLRIALAQRLLSDTTLTITQIAERCGFSGPGPLSAAFLRHLGIRPSVYRRNSASNTAAVVPGAVLVSCLGGRVRAWERPS